MSPQKIAACLMLYSGLSHPAQLLIYGTDDPDLVRSSLAGMTFLVVGALLLTGKRWATWIGITLPLLFGIGATYRIFTQDVTPFSYLHTAIDFAVVALCIFQLRLSAEQQENLSK